MQDEPGAKVRFSHKMSLNRFRVGACKLGIEHQDAGRREAKPGADPEPIEEHAQTGEMLLDRWHGSFAAHLFDVRGDVHGLHLVQLADAMLFAPGEECAGGAAVCRARVGVADVDGEEIRGSACFLSRVSNPALLPVV